MTGVDVDQHASAKSGRACDRNRAGSGVGERFRPLPVVTGVLCALLAISAFTRWYAGSVSMPRYCDDPEGNVDLVTRILALPRPAQEEARRPYVVAAKLLFLVPRRGGESIEAYRERLHVHVRAACS